jgi:hypothetical protein
MSESCCDRRSSWLPPSWCSGWDWGVNLVLFNTAYALLWRPLNFPQPDRLATLEGRSNSGDLGTTITGHDAWMIRSQSAVVSGIGLTGGRRLVSLIQGDEVIDIPSAAVDSGYFAVLGLKPVAGRLFGTDEDLGANPEQPAVLAEATWRTRFGSDASVIGRTLLLQEGGRRRHVRVVGVVNGSATLPFASDAGILLPLASASPALRMNAGDAVYRPVVRLQPGIALQQASARIDAALRAAEVGSSYGAWGHHWLQPLRSAVAPVDRTTVLLLYGAACLLLLLTCANVASLFVARSMAGTHENSVRVAVGATSRHLVLANFEEALLVCAAGTGFAFLVESWVRPLVPRFLPAVRQAGVELLETGPVLVAFGGMICLAVAVVVSAASGLRFEFQGLAGLGQGLRSGGSERSGRARSWLAAAQLAIVLTLLTVSGMVGRSFLAAMRSDRPGCAWSGDVPGVASRIPARAAGRDLEFGHTDCRDSRSHGRHVLRGIARGFTGVFNGDGAAHRRSALDRSHDRLPPDRPRVLRDARDTCGFRRHVPG